MTAASDSSGCATEAGIVHRFSTFLEELFTNKNSSGKPPNDVIKLHSKVYESYMRTYIVSHEPFGTPDQGLCAISAGTLRFPM